MCGVQNEIYSLHRQEIKWRIDIHIDIYIDLAGNAS